MQDVIVPPVFNSPTYGQMEWEEVLAKVVWFLNLDKTASYDVIIGTDSEARDGEARPHRLAKHGGQADFVTAVIVHKKGRGGVYFWGRQNVRNLYSLKQRIWHEATISLSMAQIVVDDFAKLGLFGSASDSNHALNLEIHVDIGPNGKTRELISDIVGMIRSNGFKVATKPSSWGASHVADRHV